MFTWNSWIFSHGQLSALDWVGTQYKVLQFVGINWSAGEKKNVLKDFRCLGKELGKSAIQFPSWGNLSSNAGSQNKTWQSWSLPHSVSQSAFVAFPFLRRWGCIVFSAQCWEHREFSERALPVSSLLLVILKSPQKLLLSSVANASCLWKQFQFIFYKGEKKKNLLPRKHCKYPHCSPALFSL